MLAGAVRAAHARRRAVGKRGERRAFAWFAYADRWSAPCTTFGSMTTIGQLIEALYAKYERQYHDHELAAAATQRALEKILRNRRRG